MRPGLLGPDKWSFGREYCASIPTAGGKCVPLGGGQRDWELHLLLRQAVMVRRRKVDVLIELPPKTRRWLRLLLTAADMDTHHHGDGGGDGGGEGEGEGGGEGEGDSDGIGGGEGCGGDGDGGGAADSACEGAASGRSDAGAPPVQVGALASDEDPAVIHHQVAYEAAGLAKLRAVCRFVADALSALAASESMGAPPPADGSNEAPAAAVASMLESTTTVAATGGPGKLVVFAHHRRVLDGLQSTLHRYGPLVRIDGSTPLPARHLAIKRFHSEPSLRLALVSVTAASLGIDLSAASHVIFAELPPDAAWLAQVGCLRSIEPKRAPMRL